MRAWLAIGLLALGLASCTREEPTDPAVAPARVETLAGPVVAQPAGDGAQAWFAIPYAAPPTGEFRWRPPQPAPAWDTPLTATTPGPPCAQPGYSVESSPVLGTEDCLTLNVYGPSAGADEPMPIMVWIHGGGNYAGAAGEYDGSELAARHDLLVITINYRLGPFGWFHHRAITQAQGDDLATGHFGLLDMIAALEWVQENASAFGGDPGNVTIFGESAGGQNVYALVLAERAEGLFHRAIAQSGGFWNMALDQATNLQSGTPPGTRASAGEIVAALMPQSGGDGEAPEYLAGWLRGLSTAEILAPYADQPDLGYDLPSIVLDDAMFPAAGHRAQLASGAHNAVPMIVGANKNEQKIWQALDPGFVDWSSGTARILDRDRYAAVDQHYSDWWNFEAVDDFASRYQGSIFAYRFDWDDAPTEPNDLQFLIGAAHGLEIEFMLGGFVGSQFDQLFTAENAPGRAALSQAMMSYWAAFAHYGDPGSGMAGDLPEWGNWSDGGARMIFDTGTLEMETGMMDREALLSALTGDARLSQADMCMILRHNTMYPRFDLDRLAAAGCSAPGD